MDAAGRAGGWTQAKTRMKRLAVAVLARFGIGIYRLQRPDKPSCPFVVDSPVAHNTAAGMDAFYANEAAVAAYLGPQQMAFYAELMEVLHSSGVECHGCRVADIGCGTGHLLQRLAEQFSPAALYGFDFSHEALKIARSLVPGATLAQVDINASSIPGSYDLVCCTEVLEHLLHPIPALRAVFSCVAPSGTALITVPNGRIDTFAGHVNFWSPESWEVFVGEAAGDDFTVATGMLEGGRTMYALFRCGMTRSEAAAETIERDI